MGQALNGHLSPTGRAAPRVSVLLPAYNAEAYLAQSVESILGQTFPDFELIVVDDCSKDSTLEILRSYNDPRLRIVPNARNLGVVGARNKAMSVARGDLIASFDADDVSLPTRLAKQVAYLDSNPAVALVGTASFYLENGESRPGKRIPNATPMLLRWLLHMGNPLGHPTLMYRASAVAQLGCLLLEDYKYAEDFEFYHRILAIGEVGYIDEPLILYRRHPGAISVRHETEMMAQSHRVLTDAYAPWFGAGAADAARLVTTHLFGRKDPADRPTLRRIAAMLKQATQAFLANHDVGPADRDAILAHAGALYWGAVRSSVRSGHLAAVATGSKQAVIPRRQGFGAVDSAVSAASGMVPFKGTVLPFVRARLQGRSALPARSGWERLQGVEYEPVPPDPERPATLYVVVDTEAEFDWSAPFDRHLTSVTSMAAIGRGQAVFDRYGLRPVYVTDYAVLTQAEGYEPLRRVFDRGGCEIGAHLHPWITPPFEEALSVMNSYAGNLPEDLERRKLATLLDAFRSTFGFAPHFFKAGRYGVGPNTMRLLAENGIDVDFSIIPGRDLSPKGGPDFRQFRSTPYWTMDRKVLSVPMTRGSVGLLGRAAARLPGALESERARALLIPGIFSRLRLFEAVTLTPEGEPAAKQVALIRRMLAQRERVFVLHYHSPSLAAGFTPYGRSKDDVDLIVQRMEEVCRVFFEEIGGVPGNPQDLLPRDTRRIDPLVRTVVAGWAPGDPPT